MISQTYPALPPRISVVTSTSCASPTAPRSRAHTPWPCIPQRRVSGPSVAQRAACSGSRAGRPSAASSEVERHGHEVGPPGQGLRAAPRWSIGGAGLSAHKHGSGQVHGVRCRTGAQAWGSGAGFRTTARCSACGAGLGAQDPGLRRGVPNSGAVLRARCWAHGSSSASGAGLRLGLSRAGGSGSGARCWAREQAGARAKLIDDVALRHRATAQSSW